MASTPLSDKAMGIFAFAAYHQLTSGETVTEVISADGKGHKADPEGVAALEAAGLARQGDGRVAFTPDGLTRLAAVLDALRQS